MARLFDSNIEAMKEDWEETEKLFLEVNKKPLTEDDINHGNMPELKLPVMAGAKNET